MRGARPLAVATVGLVLVASSGCSILFAKGPPERVERGQQIHCTRSYAAPVIDGIVAGSNVATTAYAISVSDAAYAKIPPYSRSAAIALGVGYAALYGISMGVGISRVGDCNELLERVGSRPDPARRRAIVGPGAPAPEWTPSGIKVKHVDEDEELDEASAAQARARAKEAEDAKAAGEAAGRAPVSPKAATPQKP